MKNYYQIIFYTVIVFASCNKEDGQINTMVQPPNSNYEVVASGYSIPWSIDIIAEDDFLFTDRLGKLYHFENGDTREIHNIPQSRSATFGGLVYGGLMEVSLHPNFSINNLVYISYVDINFYLAVARFELKNNIPVNLEVIYNSDQFSIGSRIAWQDDEHFFLSLGVGGSPYPDPGPQDLNDDKGKIHRLMADGQIPMDNPTFPGYPSPTSVWSYGHRNPQGLFYETSTQTFYANEHGPLGGDELNIITKGSNYGWPLFSYGLNYDNSLVSQMTEQEAALFSVLPAKAWGPDFRVAPSGLLKLSNSNFSSWNGSFLMGSLYAQNLLRYNLESDETEIVLVNAGRVRDIAQLPSGNLLILIDAGSPNTSDTGRIIKLVPK